ncbi:MAG: HAD family hydrolase [Bacilli bacterium]|jgi:putative hydrolase of the HAD superfamily|nr:HAD family hydrolase [Bacilli bacterium]MDD3422083.1 HAD family hydrolase [Bacilli bacterium]MDD4065598.1 HAD family hydrolase [Bacilli bacterium]
MKAILFDFWSTIFLSTYEGEKTYDGLMSYLSKNPHNYTAQEIAATGKKVFDELRGKNPITGPEFTFEEQQKIVEQLLDIEFSIPYLEREYIYLKSCHLNLRLAPHLQDLLEYAHKEDYRLAVVSNTTMHSETQKRLINEYCPNAHFEFVLSSSEVSYRKPHPNIFQIALDKLGLPAEEVYFVGDNYVADVVGSSQLNLRPVYYKHDSGMGGEPAEKVIPYLEIHDYLDFITYLKSHN